MPLEEAIDAWETAWVSLREAFRQLNASMGSPQQQSAMADYEKALERETEAANYLRRMLAEA